ncbi:MAG: hypothetical protein JRN52_15060 [Nitrososphaerota archaeon]|nr:hypothetical protein [Nitrososphaerota archaeon]
MSMTLLVAKESENFAFAGRSREACAFRVERSGFSGYPSERPRKARV